MDQHWKNVDAGCQEAVAELGNIDYTWSAPDVKDDTKQIECINNAVAVFDILETQYAAEKVLKGEALSEKDVDTGVSVLKESGF